jgi:predicted metalloprotease
MRIDDREGSSNIEDRRGARGKKAGGIGGVIITAVVVYIMSGGDMGAVLNSLLSQSDQIIQPQSKVSKQDQRYASLVSVVLKDTEDIWGEELAKYGIRYQEPKLVMYRGSTTSGCGTAQSAMGPFYCSQDQKIYVDLGFFDELRYKFGAKGDFAQAYVIAHEVAHHVQNELGILPKVHKAQRGASKKRANAISVKTELQADCFSGVWAGLDEQKNHILQRGDIDEALNAASQIGDDTLQKKAQGYTVPDSFTHGTSKQRREWFYRGFQSKSIDSCDTFKKL